MDVLYIMGVQSGNELRYSLRSIAQYGSGVSRVFLCGAIPDWVNKRAVTCIPYRDRQAPISLGIKSRNILRNALYALEHANIGEDFLVSMDDHYLGGAVDFNHYPYYAKDKYGEGCELPRRPKIGQDYLNHLYDSRLFLEAHGLPTKCLCPHRNMRCSRRWIDGAWPLIEEVLAGAECEPWVLLGNWAIAHEGIEITPTSDCKIYSREDAGRTEGRTFFSTSDFAVGSDLDLWMRERYPNPCKYEKK